MSERAYHQSLRLQNFTAFADASFEFVPGINVFVGENGTGKTHAMKAMYVWQLFRQRGDLSVQNVRQAFQVESVATLIRGSNDELAQIEGVYGGDNWYYSLWDKGGISYSDFLAKKRANHPVFVPAVDMMGHTQGFVSTYDLYKIDFDLTHREIVSLLLAPERRFEGKEAEKLGPALSNVLKGKLELEGERFYLRTNQGRFPMPAVAEGLRKIATLLRLLQGGWLQPGTTLFWDEPEVNLNPKLMDEVVAALLALSRQGVQIIFATHSYVMLEELRDQAEPGEVRYFGFQPTDEGVVVRPADDLPSLDPNPILDQYESLSNRKLKKAFVPRARA